MSLQAGVAAGCALQKGHMEVMIDSLPGFPDGVSLAEDGNFWIALAAPDQAFVKILPYRCASCSLQCLIEGVPACSFCKGRLISF